MRPGSEGQKGSQVTLIKGYEALLDHCRVMLVLARGRAWPELIEEKMRYLMEVERLGAIEAALELDETTRARRARLLERILEQNLELKRRLVEHEALLERELAGDDHVASVGSGQGNGAWHGKAPAEGPGPGLRERSPLPVGGDRDDESR